MVSLPTHGITFTLVIFHRKTGGSSNLYRYPLNITGKATSNFKARANHSVLYSILLMYIKRPNKLPAYLMSTQTLQIWDNIVQGYNDRDSNPWSIENGLWHTVY